MKFGLLLHFIAADARLAGAARPRRTASGLQVGVSIPGIEEIDKSSERTHWAAAKVARSAVTTKARLKFMSARVLVVGASVLW